MNEIKNRNIWLLAIVIFGIGLCPAIVGTAFAQMYTDADNPHGPQELPAWSTMVVVAGVASSIGIFTAVKKK